MKVTHVLVTIALLLLSPQMHAQEQKSMRELLLKMVAEREQLVEYKVHCDIVGQMGDLSSFGQDLKTTNDSKTEIDFEFSRPDRHYVTAIRNVTNGKSPWHLIGSTGDIGIFGSAGKPLEVHDLKIVYQRSFFKTEANRAKLRVFDPLSVGLVFCGEFFSGLSFESAASNFLNIPDKVSVKLSEENGLITCVSNSDTTVVFDKKSRWPVKLDYGFGKVVWDVQLDKFESYTVPKRAVLRCREGKKESTTEIQFKWIEINSPIEAGQEAAKRLAESYGM